MSMNTELYDLQLAAIQAGLALGVYRMVELEKELIKIQGSLFWCDLAINIDALTNQLAANHE